MEREPSENPGQIEQTGRIWEGRKAQEAHALGHHPQRASAVLTSPLPMQALSVRLVPAAVAVSRRGKRTDWACASVLYGAVDFFGGE